LLKLDAEDRSSGDIEERQTKTVPFEKLQRDLLAQQQVTYRGHHGKGDQSATALAEQQFARK